MSVLSMKKPVTPAPGVGGAHTPARPPKIRRRPLMLVGTIAAVVVGGLGTAWVFTASAASSEVVAVRAAVERGEVIDRTDLVVVKVGLDPSLDIVPASRIDQVVGQRAATDLAPGGLLASGSVTDEVLPKAGETLVGVGLAPTMLPAEPLRDARCPGRGTDALGRPVLPNAGRFPLRGLGRRRLPVAGGRAGELMIGAVEAGVNLVAVRGPDAAALASTVTRSTVAPRGGATPERRGPASSRRGFGVRSRPGALGQVARP